MRVKMIALLAAFVWALVMIPVDVKAAALEPYSIIAGEGCHCGGMRFETRTEDMEARSCPLAGHGAACPNYYYVTVRLYHGCTNPSCLDTWTDVSGYHTHLGDTGWLNL